MNKILMILLGFFVVKEIILMVMVLTKNIEFNNRVVGMTISVFTIPFVIVAYILYCIQQSRVLYSIEKIDNKQQYKISKPQYYRYRKKLKKEIEKETGREVHRVKIINKIVFLEKNKNIKRIKKYKEFYNIINMDIIFKDEIEDCD